MQVALKKIRESMLALFLVAEAQAYFHESPLKVHIC